MLAACINIQNKVEITGEDTTLFTCGSCDILANEIHKLTGWPIHCFLAEDEPDNLDPHDHAFIVPFEGWRLDIEGLQTADEHDYLWGCGCEQFCTHPRPRNTSFSHKQITDIWGGVSEDDEYAVERAKAIAPLLVAFAEANAVLVEANPILTSVAI